MLETDISGTYIQYTLVNYNTKAYTIQEQSFYIAEIDFKNSCSARQRCIYIQIIFNEESHFWVNGYVGKRNLFIFSARNPECTKIRKCFVRCSLHAENIIDSERIHIPPR